MRTSSHGDVRLASDLVKQPPMVGDPDALLRPRQAMPFWARYSSPVRVTFAGAFTPRAVVHGLGTTPDGVFTVRADATIIAAPGVAWTDTTATLQADASNAHAVLLFYTLREDASALADVDQTATSPSGALVAGPGSAIADDLAAFNGTTGKLLKDSGIPMAQVARRDAANTFSAGPQTLTGGALFTGGGTQTVFNDYREGNWTPTLIGMTSGTASLSSAFGFYVKTARLVWVAFVVVVSSAATCTGGLAISSLPFTASVGMPDFGPAYWFDTVSFFIAMDVAMAGSPAVIAFYARNGGSTSFLNNSLVAADVHNGTQLGGTISYIV